MECWGWAKSSRLTWLRAGRKLHSLARSPLTFGKWGFVNVPRVLIKCHLCSKCLRGQVPSRKTLTFMIDYLMTKSFAALKCDPSH